MRFRDKVVYLDLIILSVALGIMGFIMIYSNFQETLNIQTEYSIEEHNLLQANIEYQLLNVVNNPKENIQDALPEIGKNTTRQTGSDEIKLYLFYNNSLAYSNAADHPRLLNAASSENEFPKEFVNEFKYGEKKHITVKKNGQYYLYIAYMNSISEKDFCFITKREITDTYQRLYRQIRSFILLVLFVLLVCGILLFLIGSRLTKPLETLNKVTGLVAQGDYHIQAEIHTNDEISILAGKFNDMTRAVARHIEELNLMVKQREQFVADFTHEIKTPMTAIIGYADTLRHKSLTGERQKLACDYIYSEGKRLEKMSMKLFDLIFLRENELTKSEFSVTAMLTEVIASMAPVCRAKDISIRSDVEEKDLFGDSELLKTVFINLIDNAKKASSGHDEIVLSGKCSDDAYIVTVTDHGTGMDEETVRHIYDEFFMGDKSRSRAEGGAGLGMSLASLIIKKHGGHIEIESGLQKGSTFSVYLPLT